MTQLNTTPRSEPLFMTIVLGGTRSILLNSPPVLGTLLSKLQPCMLALPEVPQLLCGPMYLSTTPSARLSRLSFGPFWDTLSRNFPVPHILHR